MEKPVAYQCDHNGFYVGTSPRQQSPLEPGVWLIPAGCVLVAPPAIPEGQRAFWNGTAWQLQAIPAPVVVSTEPVAPPAPVIQTPPAGA